MKDISANLKTHIQGEVTTICTCVLIRRRDKYVIGLTNLDAPITVNNQLYRPYDSFIGSSIASSSNLEVDSMEIDAILNSSAIARADIAGGMYDFSQVSVFIVNYNSVTDGILEMRDGWIGEIEMMEDNSFHAEIRGLSQTFAYRVGQPYTPECTADLGDNRCHVGLDPDFWQPLFAYAQGDCIIGHITSPTDYVNGLLTNNEFQDETINELTRNLENWTTYGDVDGRWTIRTSWHSLTNSPTGIAFAAITDNIATVDTHYLGMYQDVDLVASGLSTGDIDTGNCMCVFTGYVACMTSDSKSSCRLQAIDTLGRVTTIFDPGAHTYGLNRWIPITTNSTLIPAGTRQIRVDFNTTKKRTVENGGAFGGYTLSFNDPDGTFNSDLQADGVMFQAQNGGLSGTTEPAFSALLDATYTDGAVTWKCIASFKDVTTVTTVVENNEFTCTLPHPAAYYDAGLLIWETGANAGNAMQVKTWDGTNLTLFQPPYRPLTVGDRFVIHPGCDKTRATCISKFNNILNFRGFPDVPGADAYMATPDVPTN